MLTRLRETIQILSYREPHEGPHGPDVHFVRQENPHYSPIRLKIAKTVGVIFVVYAVGKVATPCVDAIQNALKGHSPSATSLAGGVGAVCVLVFNWVRNSVERSIHTNIRLEENLAPYFGRRIENVIRALKGNPRAT